MTKETRRRLLQYASPFVCAALYAAVILASRPFAEIGIEDDWSYVRSAQVLAETGHLTYNGWATAMLGPQLYLGAFAFHLFGFSFTVARCVVLLLGMLATVVMQRVFLRFGLNQFNATATTLLVMLSPIVQPLSFTFHTDVPGLLFVLLGLYCCQRATTADSTQAVLLWLALGSVSGVIGGSIRQIAWLTALVMVPSAAWLRRRSRGVIPGAAVLWAMSFAAVVGILHWFNAQPYSVPEHLKTNAWRTAPAHLLFWGGGLVLAFPLLVLPFLVAVAWDSRRQGDRRTTAILAALSLLVPLATMWHFQFGFRWLAPYAVNILSPRGLVDNNAMLGERPGVLGTPFRYALSALSLFCALVTLRTAVTFVSHLRRRALRPAWQARLVLIIPFCAAYVLLLLPRACFGVPLDRYLIPLAVIAAATVVQMHQDRFASRLPTVGLVTGVSLVLAGFIGMHDLFAFERARLLAIQEIRAAGVPRELIGGGFEYDGWTQITSVGTLTDPRIRVPYSISPYMPSWRTGTCHGGTEFLMSGVHPRYYLSLDPTLCREQSQFPAQIYHPWFPMRPISIFVLKADQPDEWRNDSPHD